MIPILYSSQTGNGMVLAYELQKDIKNSVVLSIDEFDLLKLNDFKLIIFICSTHGDGQPPFTMSKFYNLLTSLNINSIKENDKINAKNFSETCKNEINADNISKSVHKYSSDLTGSSTYSLPIKRKLESSTTSSKLEDSNNLEKSNVSSQNKIQPKIFTFKSCVLGLGDSKYPKYNYCARTLIQKLKSFGSDVIVKDFCNGQDPNGNNDGFERFREKIKSIDLLELDSNVELENIKTATENFDLTVISNDLKNSSNIEYLPEQKARSLTSKISVDSKDLVYELTFSLENFKDFTPGDCIAIYPVNNVDLSHFNYSSFEVDYLKNNVDLLMPVPQVFFKNLSEYAQSQLYKDKLLEISQDYDLYNDYIYEFRRSILDVISDFQLSLPFEFFKMYPRIIPRYYTFCRIEQDTDIPSNYPESNRSYYYSILYNIVDYKIGKRHILGLCSNYMKSLTKGMTIKVKILKSNLFLEDRNLLFLSSGTGVTLPRSALHYYKNSHKSIVVFYGFRFYSNDQLLVDDFKRLHLRPLIEHHNNGYKTNDENLDYQSKDIKEDYHIIDDTVDGKQLQNLDDKNLNLTTATSYASACEKSFNIAIDIKDSDNKNYDLESNSNKNSNSNIKNNIVDSFDASKTDKLKKGTVLMSANTKLYLVSSRDDKIYITDKFKQNPIQDIDKWLVFVSGNCRLNREFKELFKEVYGKNINFQSETW